MNKFITYLICKGYLSGRQQASRKMIKILLKRYPHLTIEFLKRV